MSRLSFSFFYFRILTFWFLLLAGSLNHFFAYSLGPWENISASELVQRSTIGGEVTAPVYERRGFVWVMTSVETSLDTMHQSCSRVRHGHSGYGGGHGGGYGGGSGPLVGH